jgi:hypothetical protein
MPPKRKPTSRAKGRLDKYAVPGSTRGEPTGASFSFYQWPYSVSGQLNISPASLDAGSNLQAVKNLSGVQNRARPLAKKAGLDKKTTGNPSGLNGMPSN